MSKSSARRTLQASDHQNLRRGVTLGRIWVVAEELQYPWPNLHGGVTRLSFPVPNDSRVEPHLSPSSRPREPAHEPLVADMLADRLRLFHCPVAA